MTTNNGPENRLESGADPQGRRNEQVARSFAECKSDCPWYGRCLNGTRFDDGNGGLKPGNFAPWLYFGYYSPCFLIKGGKNDRIREQ
jgi:hypothetical protein